MDLWPLSQTSRTMCSSLLRATTAEPGVAFTSTGLTVPYLPGTVVHVNSVHAVLPRERSQLSDLGNVRIRFRTCAMYERDLVPGKRKKRRKVGTAVTAVTTNLYTRTLTQRSQRNLYMEKTAASTTRGSYHVRHVQISNVPGTVQVALYFAREVCGDSALGAYT